MEPQRTKALVMGTLLFLIFVPLLVAGLFKPWPPSSGYIFGIVVGFICGGLVCANLKKTWDPVHLRPYDPRTKPASLQGCGPVVSIVGAVVIANIARFWFSFEIRALLASSCLVCGLVIAGYMMIQGWRHRPRG